MIRFDKIASTENVYPYVKATAAAEYVNGAMGTVSNGVFTAGTGAFYIDQVERGDDMYSDDFKIGKGADVRVVDMSKVIGHEVDITKQNLPKTYEVGKTLAAGSDGMLTVSDSLSGYGFKVKKVTAYGVLAEIVNA